MSERSALPSMPVTSRPYRDEGDYARMRALLTDLYRQDGPAVYCTVGDLDWWRSTDDDPAALAQARLWTDEAGAVVGFAWPGGEQVDLIAHPRHRALEGAMLAWAERRRLDGAAGPVALTAWAFDESDTGRQALLRDRGYARADRCLIYRGWSLDGPPPEPRLPPGYTLRHVRGEEDIERRVAVHRDAFAPSRMTAAKQRAVMQAPTYRPDLDLVAVAPDRTFAAFCIVWFDAANRIGVFEPVGCHSAHRRRGLARALLHEGLRRLQRLGARAAYVNSHGAEAAANALYESAGFRIVDRNRAWQKTLLADRGPTAGADDEAPRSGGGAA